MSKRLSSKEVKGIGSLLLTPYLIVFSPSTVSLVNVIKSLSQLNTNNFYNCTGGLKNVKWIRFLTSGSQANVKISVLNVFDSVLQLHFANVV